MLWYHDHVSSILINSIYYLLMKLDIIEAEKTGQFNQVNSMFLVLVAFTCDVSVEDDYYGWGSVSSGF
jgi:hypothetical protein